MKTIKQLDQEIGEINGIMCALTIVRKHVSDPDLVMTILKDLEKEIDRLREPEIELNGEEESLAHKQLNTEKQEIERYLGWIEDMDHDCKAEDGCDFCGRLWIAKHENNLDKIKELYEEVRPKSAEEQADDEAQRIGLI